MWRSIRLLNITQRPHHKDTARQKLNLGTLYCDHHLVEPDYAKAIELFKSVISEDVAGALKYLKMAKRMPNKSSNAEKYSAKDWFLIKKILTHLIRCNSASTYVHLFGEFWIVFSWARTRITVQLGIILNTQKYSVSPSTVISSVWNESSGISSSLPHTQYRTK